jgi:hypothetical protein
VFELMDCIDVRCYILLLLYYILLYTYIYISYYYILYYYLYSFPLLSYTLLFFSSFSNLSSVLLFPSSPILPTLPSMFSSHIPLIPSVLPILSSHSHPLYTPTSLLSVSQSSSCPHSNIHSIPVAPFPRSFIFNPPKILKNILTPHVLSEWMVEVCAGYVREGLVVFRAGVGWLYLTIIIYFSSFQSLPLQHSHPPSSPPVLCSVLVKGCSCWDSGSCLWILVF